jgi:flagellar motor switch protein FliN/FliY
MNESRKQPLKEILGDIPVPIKCFVGRKLMTAREIMSLEEGSVISFPKVVGEPVDITISGNEMARGEVVVVNERYGVRVSEIL